MIKQVFYFFPVDFFTQAAMKQDEIAKTMEKIASQRGIKSVIMNLIRITALEL